MKSRVGWEFGCRQERDENERIRERKGRAERKLRGRQCVGVACAEAPWAPCAQNDAWFIVGEWWLQQALSNSLKPERTWFVLGVIFPPCPGGWWFSSSSSMALMVDLRCADVLTCLAALWLLWPPFCLSSDQIPGQGCVLLGSGPKVWGWAFSMVAAWLHQGISVGS
jgi:hypothetical protein